MSATKVGLSGRELRATGKSIPVRLGDTIRIDGLPGWWRVRDVNLGGKLIVTDSRVKRADYRSSRGVDVNQVVEWRRSP